MSIRLKVLLAIMLAVVLSIFGVTVMVSHEMNKAFTNNFRVSSKAQLDRMNAFVDNFLTNAVSSADLLAASPLTTEAVDELTSYIDGKGMVPVVGENLFGAERELFRELARINNFFPAFMQVYVSNNSGGLVNAPDMAVPGGYNPSQRPWYTATAQAGRSLISQSYLSDAGMPVCTISSPVRKSSGIAGIVAIDISLTTLTEEVGKAVVGDTGYVVMLDAFGKVISDPKNSGSSVPEAARWLGKSTNELPGDAAAAVTSLRNKKQGYTEVEMSGKSWLASVQETKQGWTLIMLQEKEEVFSDAMGVTMSILFVGLGIAAVMLATSWFITNSIATPVGRLASAAEAVSNGNFGSMPQDENLFKGELGILHKSLKRMVANLVELLDTAKNKMQEAEQALEVSKNALLEAEEAKQAGERARSEGVRQTAAQLGSVISELSAATHRLADEAAQTNTRTSVQQERVSGTAAAIVQMHAAVSDVARSTSRTAQLAEDARTEAKNGRKLVMEVLDSMGEIEKQSLAMSDSLAELGNQAKDIGQIMSVINDIADQTNLLALNAAIEAARAGDAGRGFAVVADEVRKLAEKTMEATRQVGEAIHTIQNGTMENMQAMQQAAAYISESAKVADKAGGALSGIESMVENTAGEVRAIATASEEQSATLEEVNRSTDGISAIAAEVADSARQSDIAVQELTQLSDRLSSIVEELKNT